MSGRNRAERRREERQIRTRPLGFTERIDPDALQGRRLPPKTPGEHRWVAIATYVIPNVPRVGEGEMYLDHENLWDVSYGCLDCNEPWSSTLGTEPCYADEWIPHDA